MSLRDRRWLVALAYVAAGCGGAATTASPSPSVPLDPTPPVATTASASARPSALDWMSNEVVSCARSASEPDGAPIAGAGTSVRVRERSIAFDLEGLVVCEARGTWRGQLVLIVEPISGLSVGVLDGDRIVGVDDAPPIVRVAGATEVTAIRFVSYCPDGSRDCVIAGGRDAIEAYSDHDPAGPRSGWDVTTTALVPVPRRRAGTTWLDERVCGLEVGLRDAPEAVDECSGTLAERLACFSRVAIDDEEEEDEEDEDEARAGAGDHPWVLVLADARREITLPAREVASVACVDAWALLRRPHADFSSVRGYGAIPLRGGRLGRGHTMSIRDHEEAMSDCGNAWDGVELVPVLRDGVPIGGLVLGAGGRPLFELARGDVGDVQTPAFWPGDDGAPPREVNEVGFAYGDEPVPIALRETADGLLAVAAPPGASEVCTLEVDDTDGWTNVRPDPSTRHAPRGTLPNGTRLVPVEQRGRWYRIETPAQGWVFATSLRRRCEPPPVPLGP